MWLVSQSVKVQFGIQFAFSSEFRAFDPNCVTDLNDRWQIYIGEGLRMFKITNYPFRQLLCRLVGGSRRNFRYRVNFWHHVKTVHRG